MHSVILDPSHGGVDLGYCDGVNCEKNFSLKILKKVYQCLKKMNFPVFITRSDDYTISNYDRHDIIESLVKKMGHSLVISLHIDNENAKGIKIINSINNETDANKFHILNDVTEVINKTLPIDSSSDYYEIQRLSSDDAEVVVIEFGHSHLQDDETKIEEYSDELVDVLIDFYADDVNFQ